MELKQHTQPCQFGRCKLYLWDASLDFQRHVPNCVASSFDLFNVLLFVIEQTISNKIVVHNFTFGHLIWCSGCWINWGCRACTHGPCCVNIFSFVVKRDMAWSVFLDGIVVRLQVKSFDCFIRAFLVRRSFTILVRLPRLFCWLMLFDAVLISGLRRISWNEKACCPHHFNKHRQLLFRDVMKQIVCIVQIVSIWLLEHERQVSLWTACETCLFHGWSQV